jgi:hypothetical protein
MPVWWSVRQLRRAIAPWQGQGSSLSLPRCYHVTPRQPPCGVALLPEPPRLRATSVTAAAATATAAVAGAGVALSGANPCASTAAGASAADNMEQYLSVLSALQERLDSMAADSTSPQQQQQQQRTSGGGGRLQRMTPEERRQSEEARMHNGGLAGSSCCRRRRHRRWNCCCANRCVCLSACLPVCLCTLAAGLAAVQSQLPSGCRNNRRTYQGCCFSLWGVHATAWYALQAV